MTNLIAIFIVIAFAAKLLWNVVVPLSWLMSAIEAPPGGMDGTNKNLSFAPFVEILLLIALVIISVFGRNGWLTNTGYIFLIGAVAIFISYLAVFLLGVISRRRFGEEHG